MKNKRIGAFILVICIIFLGLILAVLFFYPKVNAKYLAMRSGVPNINSVKILYSSRPPAFGEYELHCFLRHSPKMIADVMKERKSLKLEVDTLKSSHLKALHKSLMEMKKQGAITENFTWDDSCIALVSSSIDKGKIIHWIIAPSKKYSFISIYAFH